MPSQMARILNDYRRSMPESGRGMAQASDAYFVGQGNKRKQKQVEADNVLKQKADTRAEEKAGREEETHAEGKRIAAMRQTLGPVTAADTEDKWISAQQSGFIPKELKFANREPFIMATMTESERLARGKDKRSRVESDRKYQETVRHNRATEANALKKGAGKGGKGGDARGVKATDERFISSEVAGLFDGIYDIRSGTLKIKDDGDRRLAKKIVKDAARLAANTPNMTLSQAVATAADRNGINISEAGKPSKAGTPAPKDDIFGWRAQ